MLDCGLSLQSVLNFLPLTLQQHGQRRDLPSWLLPGADLGGELRENCDRVFVDAAPEFCPPLDKLVDFGQVDVILISNYLCMLALPYVTEATGFRGRVLATEPTLHIGRLLLEELVEYVSQSPDQQTGLKGQQWKNLVHRLPYPLSDAFKPKSWRHIYTQAQVNASLARVSLVGYGERVDVFGVQVTPASSGFCLGSSNWVISSAHEKLVYLSGSSTLTTHPRSIDHSSLRNADVLIMTDLTQTPVSNPDAMLGVLCVVVGLTLRGGGNVLIPCYPTGVVYDLFECLSVKMADLGVAGCPMYFISPVAEQSLAYSNILAEWLSGVKQSKVYVPDDPFPHALLLRSGKLKHFKHIYSPGFSTDFQEPCVVFCGHPSLRFGDVVQFIELWGQNPRNCIVFTEPDFDYIDALAPHQPLQMKVAHCAIDTSLNFTQANKLVRELKPGALVVPECYTRPPVETTVIATNGTSKLPFELVISVGESAATGDSKTLTQTQLITYRWGEVVQLPVRRKRARLHLDNQVAQRLVPVLVDPVRPLAGTSGTVSLATVTGALNVRDGVYTVTELKETAAMHSKAARYEYGTVNVSEFLQRLAREGITDAKVEQMTGGAAGAPGAGGIMIHLPEHDALIQIEDNCTHVLCNSDERLRSRLRSILMHCLNKF